MNRPSILLTVAFLAVAACSSSARHVSTAEQTPPAPLEGTASIAGPLPSFQGGTERYHPNFSAPYGRVNYCDYPNPLPTVRDFMSDVGKGGGNPRSSALVHVTEIRPPRWNTRDGHRPTQEQVNAMIDEYDVDPGIYTPIAMRIDRFYSGLPMPREIIAFAGTGRIGEDETKGCAFGSATSLQIRGGPERMMIGGTYIVLLGKELLAGEREDRLSMPIIDNVFVVRNGHVIAMDGEREPLP